MSKNPEAIRGLMEQLDHFASEIVRECIHLTYYMRGSVSYDRMLCMSYYERELMADFIKDHLENEKKNPFGGNY